jgi:hypothetical protein
VDANAVLTKYTYNGDGDLDGKITIDDYFLIDKAYATRAAGSAAANAYRSGDFDYDADTDADDYFMIDAAFNGQGPPISDGSGSTAMPSPTTGWTDFTPSPDSRVIYVSSSTGSDSNDGLSEAAPLQTLAKAQKLMRKDKPDWLLLKRGDVWTGERFANWGVGGRDEDEPMLISAYGTGTERPMVQWTGSGGAFEARSGNTINHLAIVGIHFSGGDSIKAPQRAGVGLDRLAPGEDFLIEDCVFENFGTGLAIQGYYNTIEDVRIRRSVIADNAPISGHAQGLYMNHVDGILLEENLFDHNGWGNDDRSDATIFNHNIYLAAENDGVVIRRNIIANASSHGMQVRPGGIVEDNLLIKNPIGMSYGLVNGAMIHPGGVSGHVTGNVIMDAADVNNGALRGWALEVSNIQAGSGTEISNNIFAHDKSRGSFAAVTLAAPQGVTNPADAAGIRDLSVENNIIYDWDAGFELGVGLSGGIAGATGYNGIEIRGNDIQPGAGSKWVVSHQPSYSDGNEMWEDNTYSGGANQSKWFKLAGPLTFVSVPTWKGTVESTASTVPKQYLDPNRSVGGYAQTIGLAADTEAFLDAARTQSRQSWDPTLMAAPVLAYIREGFEPAPT